MKNMFRAVFFSVLCLMAASAFAQTGESMKVPSKEMGNSASPYSHDTSLASVPELLAHNPKLSEKVQSMLPEGTNLKVVSQGFLQMDTFVAAVHAADNLKVPFDQLRAKMVGADSVDLKKAIHILKPDVDNKAEAKKAAQQAKQDFKDVHYKG